MARIPYLHREDLPEVERRIFDRLERERAVPTGNLFLALAHVPNVLGQFLSYADEIRHGTKLDPKLRELAILTVGDVVGSEYEVLHHHRHGLAAGVREEQLKHIAEFETSPHFNEEERAIMAFAKESTLKVNVEQSTWDRAALFLDQRRMMELIVNIGWYNSGVRIMGAIKIDLEEKYRKSH